MLWDQKYCYLTGLTVIIFFSKLVSTKIIEGELITKENWVFLTRFCFLSNVGQFEYEVTYPKEYEPQNLLLYFDAHSQWPSVYKSNKDCDAKESVLKVEFNQIINLTESDPNYRATFASGCKLIQYGDEEAYYNCTHFRKFQSSRERWWFIALDNCKSTKGLRLRYKITMINNADNALLKHFSADEFYILHTDVIFALLFYLLFLASCYEAYALYSRHLFHVTYKMYLISLLSECIGITFLVVHFAIYANDGQGSDLLKLLGKTYEAISTLVFLLLLILLAKGFTITRARLKPSTSLKISVFMACYTLIYATLFFYQQQFFDPGEVLYIYESPVGYGLIALRLIGWGWFVYAIVFTLIHYPGKSVFFTRLFLTYSIWFISAPIVILISTFVVPKWMREKIINSVELFIALKAHFIFYILTRPSAANRNFPFHVRTTQIAVMAKDGATGDGTLESFSHYQYAPSRPATQQSHPIFALSNGVVGNYSYGITAISNGNGTSTNSTSNNTSNNNSNANNSNPTMPAADC